MRGELLSDTDTSRLRIDSALFSQWEKDLEAGTSEAKDIVMLEIEARLRRLSAILPATPSAPRKRTQRLSLQDGGLNKVEQMACLVAQRYTEPLTVTEISQAVSLHP
jgi:hypothetical protein